MSQIKKKVVGNNEIDGAKIRLDNNQALRSRNAANDADIDAFTITNSDQFLFGGDLSEISANGLLIDSVSGILPSSPSSQDIGSASLRWNVAYINSVDGGTNLHLDATGAVRSSAPIRLYNADSLSPTGRDPGEIYFNTGSGYPSVLIGGVFEPLALGSESANKTLSNLNSPVALNQDLLPDTNGGRNLGSSSFKFNEIHGKKAIIVDASGDPDLYIESTSSRYTRMVVPNAPYSEQGFSDIYNAVYIGAESNEKAIIVGDSVSDLIITTRNSSNDTGNLFLRSGNASSANDSGNVTIEIGSVSTGTRGKIIFKDGSEGTAGHVWTSSGTNGEGYWAAPTGSTPTFNKQSITLTATDITNQYVNLSAEALANSLLMVFNGVVQWEGVDYTLSVVGGVTRVTFAGDLATGGAAELVAGDILRFQYVEA